jgi:hypothetical protein
MVDTIQAIQDAIESVADLDAALSHIALDATERALDCSEAGALLALLGLDLCR